MIYSQRPDTPVIGGLRLFGKEAGRNPLIMVTVVGYTGTAFSMPWAVVGAGAVPVIVTFVFHRFLSFLFAVVFSITIAAAL